MEDCDRFRELVWAQTDELEHDEAAALAGHLQDCAACRSEADGVAHVRVALAPSGDEEPPGEEVLERVKSRLAMTGASAPPTAEVLTPEELAQFLRVPVEEIYESLGELPAFEIGGRVRFRRVRIEVWIEEQEQRWRQQALAASVRR